MYAQSSGRRRSERLALKVRRKRQGMPLNTVEPKRRRIASIPRRFIPPEVTRDILSRLPVRSLVRFRPVCILWHSIIRDPHFMESHLERSRNTRLPSIVFPPIYRAGDLLYIVRLDANKHLSSSVAEPYFSKMEKSNRSMVTGSCNGLICIAAFFGDSVKVLNPSTGESLTPPKRTAHNFSIMVYLGYHPVTKEYKLVNLFPDGELKKLGGLWFGCEVYTLGTKSWRKHPTRLAHPPAQECVLVSASGSMFWSIDRWSYEVSFLRFDLKDEVFFFIPTLHIEKIYQRKMVYGSLVDLQDSICVPVFPWSQSAEIPQKMDLWELIDEQHLWTRKYSIICPWGDCLLPTPLLIHNDMILVHIVQSSGPLKKQLPPSFLRYYSLSRGKDNQGSSEILEEVKALDKFDYLCPFVHVESLVPLFEVVSKI